MKRDKKLIKEMMPFNQRERSPSFRERIDCPYFAELVDWTTFSVYGLRLGTTAWNGLEVGSVGA